ncbi:MAG: DNA cytosine methyltransferase [Bacteroidales bacterium]|nr:DNA cytosine methyltransferase [Bacteroidales bacterium]
MKNKYNAISLFSGAMGLDLGIEAAGFEIKVCVEMDHWAAETIRINTSIPVIEKDINDVSSEDILKASGLKRDNIDLVVGGPPCQAFSTAGKQRGFSDIRGGCIIQFIRVVSDLKPKYFILENVRGILSAKLNAVPEAYKEYDSIKMESGSVLKLVLNEFNKLGYSISYALLNAANYGVPEKRERVVMIGHLGDRVPIPAPTHSESGAFGTKKWVSLRDSIGDLQGKPMRYIPLRSRMEKYMKLIGEGENWTKLDPAVAKEAMGKAYVLSGGKTGFLRRLSFDEPAPTLVTSPTMPATQLCHPKELRPLSVEEYARIQQFPDTWIFEGRIESIYKQIGNAVPVGLGKAVGNQIIRHINHLTSPTEEEDNRIPYSRYTNSTDSVCAKYQHRNINLNKKNYEQQS